MSRWVGGGVTALGRVARRLRLGPTNGQLSAAHRPRSAAAAGRPVLRLEPPPVAEGVEPLSAKGAYAPLLEKCHRYTRAREVRASGLYPYFRPISDSEDTVVVDRGAAADHARLEQLSRPDAPSEGARSGRGRPAAVRLRVHGQPVPERHARPPLSARGCPGRRSSARRRASSSPPATWRTSASSPGSSSRRDVVYLDKLDHASIVDGAQLSAGEVVRFNHGDLADLERKMAAHDETRPRARDGRRRVLDGGRTSPICRRCWA